MEEVRRGRTVTKPQSHDNLLIFTHSHIALSKIYKKKKQKKKIGIHSYKNKKKV